MPIEAIVKKVKKSLTKRGLLGTLQHSARAAHCQIQALAPRGRRAQLQREAVDREFDCVHNVDTGGTIHLADLSIDNANWEFGVHYEPIRPGEFRDLLAGAQIDCSQFTLVDFGSGKGRALLLASEYPFQKILGVEFSPELVGISRKNLLGFRGQQRCRNIEVHCGDATAFPIPAVPLVLFFNNPFEEQVMAAVVNNVRTSLLGRPRPLVVLYAAPRCDALWASIEMLEQVEFKSGYSIYKTRILENSK